MRHIPHPLAALVLCAALAACSHHSRPEGVMDEAQMVDFLTEAYLLEAFHAVGDGFDYATLTDSARADYDRLLSDRGLTAVQVEQSYDYYSQHPDLFASVVRQAEQRLNALLPENKE